MIQFQFQQKLKKIYIQDIIYLIKNNILIYL